jgi:homoserine O-acetyltransferase/O-succinyltransferase
VTTDWLLFFGGVAPLLFVVCPSKQSGATKNVAMRIYLFFLMALSLVLRSALADESAKPGTTAMASAEGNYTIKDFHFADGETLPQLRIHYRTLGEPVSSSGRIQNAVLLLHGTSSTGDAFLAEGFRSAMFGAGQPLDVSKYYLILPDSIGLGGSSKPSDGLHARFPHYGYHDMVEAQKQLLTQGLGVRHLAVVLGTSMGGMHAWLWAEEYPEMMDAVIPIASQAERISGRNLLWRRMICTAIRSDPEWKNGEYQTQPGSWQHIYPLFLMMLGNPRSLQQEAGSLEETRRFLDSAAASIRSNKLDANDLIYRLEASADYDPAPDLRKVRAAVLSINFADDEINPPELGFIARAKEAVPNGQFVLIPASNQTAGHQTLARAAVYEKEVADFLAKARSANSQ